MARYRSGSDRPGDDFKLIFPWAVRNRHTGKMVRRKDGKRFRIWVRVKRNQ